ncbi:MAG: GTP 3',8-cyclase MoaA [Hyphomicrobiales bacterium]
MKHTLIDNSVSHEVTRFDNAALNAPAPKLADNFGRQFPYLRISITDVCNFSCDYCLPNGYKCTAKKAFLALHEIENLVRAFADLGTHKIRLTGGEPTLRKDFTEIVQAISTHKAIKKLAVTTNGYKLEQNIEKWHAAGINALNVSIDTLDQVRFAKLTGHDRLPEIMAGIERALEVGFEQVKVNAVLLKGMNDDQLLQFMALVKDKPISIRYIELMQTGDNLDYFNQYHIAAETLQNRLLAQGWKKQQREDDAGPAVELSHDDYRGSIGFIAPYSKDFCTGCNRLRITATGDLRLCLFGNQGTSLRHLLQNENQQEELKALIQKQLSFKASSHFLALGDTGFTANLSTIGG